MLNVLLTIHMIACVALVIAVMLQRSEGGALGMGGGGTGGLISGRGAAGVLVKTTMVLAGIFFVTSITMTALNNSAANEGSLLERQVDQSSGAIGAPTTTTTPAAPAPTTTAPDPLGAPSTTTTTPAPAPTTPAPAPAAPARDPLAPATNTAPATTPPATTAPTTPAPTPENGGSPN